MNGMRISQGDWRAGSADLLVAALLLAGTVLYLASVARYLDPQDEGLFLYEAVRVLNGEIFYRDIFEIITPGGQYFIAACFWLFGASMTTARIAMAVLHGITVVSVFGACRTLGCRRGLAAAAGLTVIALFQPAWPYVSAHWMTTMLSMLLLWIALYRPWAGRPWCAGLLGVLAGLLIATQQHKGILFTAGACLLLVLDWLLHWEEVGADRRGWLATRLAYLLGGVALVIIPLFGSLLRTAGFGPIRRALWDQPLLKYRSKSPPQRWGQIGLFNRQLVPYTSTRLLAVLPAVLLLALGRALARSWRAASRPQAWPLAVLTLVGGVSVASSFYAPDFIHLAFIAPVCVVALAETLERGGQALARWRPQVTIVGPILTTCLLAALGAQLYRNLARGMRDYPVAMQSSFGRIDLGSQDEADHFARIRALVQASETKELFCYPSLAALYLITGAKNPTPYQILHPLYNFDEQLAETIDILERRRVPYVAVVVPFLKPGDPIAAYVNLHYEPVDGSNLLYRRKAS